jgi:denticleless
MKGYNCIKLNPTGDRLYAAGSNNYIYEFDSNSLVQTNSYSNPKYESNSFYIKIDISVCGNFLASGSKDGDVYLWQVQDPLQQAVLKGHRAEVSCVSWSKKEHKVNFRLMLNFLFS